LIHAIALSANLSSARTDISRRVRIVSTMRLHCCRGQWNAYTRDTLKTWADASPDARPMLVALHWDADTGRLSKLTDREEPVLRAMISLLLETPDADTLDARLQETLDRLVAGRNVR